MLRSISTPGRSALGSALARGLVCTLLVAAMTACSPEATRTRGGGPGADVGNRDYPLPEIHGDASNPSFAVPRVGQAIQK